MAVATATKITPLGDRALVKPTEREEMSKGGVILPDTAKEKPQEGEVIAVGSGRTREDGTKVPMEIKAGDRVLYGKYAGTEIKIDGQEHLIVSEKDVLAVIQS
jgi:chaperonin GroES